MLLRTVTCIVAGVVIYQGGIARAQSTSDHSKHAMSQRPTNAKFVIDGARTPSEIPEALCMKMLLVALAADAADDRAAFSIKTARMGLPSADLEVLQRAVATFRPALQAHQRSLGGGAASARINSAAVIQNVLDKSRQFDAFVADVHSAVMRDLSDGGRAKLSSYLAYMKTRIRIVGPPEM